MKKKCITGIEEQFNINRLIDYVNLYNDPKDNKRNERKPKTQSRSDSALTRWHLIQNNLETGQNVSVSALLIFAKL